MMKQSRNDNIMASSAFVLVTNIFSSLILGQLLEGWYIGLLDFFELSQLNTQE